MARVFARYESHRGCLEYNEKWIGNITKSHIKGTYVKRGIV